MTLVTASDKNSLCPVNLDLNNSKIVLQNDSDGEDNHSFDVQEFGYNNTNGAVNFTNTAITIQESTDVNFGQFTIFHGPVTIQSPAIQNKEEKDDKQQENKSQNETKLVKPPELSKDYHQVKECPHLLLKSPLARFTLIAVIIVTVTIIVLCVTLIKSQDDATTIYPPSDDNSTKLGNHTLIYRNVWGGQPPLNFTKPLKHPTSLVIISHTATAFCTTIPECSNSVLSIQQNHINNLHSPDIGYNFLIGGDGNIYIGRDWDTRNFHRDNSIGICFIGNFIYDHLSDEMIDAAKVLLQFGVDNEKLRDDYTLVCHNQTMATESPGANVYKEIKKWPHFQPGHLYYIIT